MTQAQTKSAANDALYITLTPLFRNIPNINFNYTTPIIEQENKINLDPHSNTHSECNVEFCKNSEPDFDPFLLIFECSNSQKKMSDAQNTQNHSLLYSNVNFFSGP